MGSKIKFYKANKQVTGVNPLTDETEAFTELTAGSVDEGGTMKQLVIDLDLSLESNKKQTINLLEKVKEINPKATKVNFYELIYWQSARQKRLNELGWESKYLLSDKVSFKLATQENEIGVDNYYYKTIGKLEGSINSKYECTGSRTELEYEVETVAKSHIHSNCIANGRNEGYVNVYVKAIANAYATAEAIISCQGVRHGKFGAIKCKAIAIASSMSQAKVNGAMGVYDIQAIASAYAYAACSLESVGTGYAYADEYGRCINFSSNEVTLLATKNGFCEAQTASVNPGSYIDNNRVTVIPDFISKDIDVPIIIYDDKFELTYTHQTIDKAKIDWTMDTNLDNGDILLFKPKLLVSYQ